MIYIVSKNKEFKFKNGEALYEWALRYRPYWFSKDIQATLDEKLDKETKNKNASSKKKRIEKRV